MNDFQQALKALPQVLAEIRDLEARVDLDRGIIELTADEVAAKPQLIWNAFLTLLRVLPDDRMTEPQRSAKLTFSYDGEVQNGGHLQFFVNKHRSHRDVVGALERLSLSAHADLLRKAFGRWDSRRRFEPASADEFAALCMEQEFADIDAAYHLLTPTISKALEALLKEHQVDFVRVRA